MGNRGQRWVQAAVFIVAAGCGTTAGRTAGYHDAPGVAEPVVARSQAPGDPPIKAPDFPLPKPVVEPEPGSVPVQPASVSGGSPASAVPASLLSSSRPDLSKSVRVKIAAFIGTDAVVTDDEVRQMVRQQRDKYVQLAGPEREAKEKEIYRDELRKIIDRELVLTDMFARLKKGKKEGVIATLQQHAGSQAERQIREVRKRLNIASETEFVTALDAMGMSYQGYKRYLERQEMAGIYLREMMKDKAKSVSLAEVQGYYERHPDEFKVEDRAKWLDLFVAVYDPRFPTPADARRYAEGVARQAKGGADFGKLVEQHGMGDSKLRKGEGIGQKRGEILPAELERHIFALGAGQVGGPVETPTGFHVLKVVERDVAGVRPFDQAVQTDIRNKIAGQTQRQEVEKILDDLWRKYRPTVVEQ